MVADPSIIQDFCNILRGKVSESIGVPAEEIAISCQPMRPGWNWFILRYNGLEAKVGVQIAAIELSNSLDATATVYACLIVKGMVGKQT